MVTYQRQIETARKKKTPPVSGRRFEFQENRLAAKGPPTFAFGFPIVFCGCCRRRCRSRCRFGCRFWCGFRNHRFDNRSRFNCTRFRSHFSHWGFFGAARALCLGFRSLGFYAWFGSRLGRRRFCFGLFRTGAGPFRLWRGFFGGSLSNRFRRDRFRRCRFSYDFITFGRCFGCGLLTA